MSSIPVMWLVWGFSFLALIAFRVYVSRIRRNEDVQLVLQTSSAHIGQEQAAITARLESTKTAGKAILGIFCAVTLYVLGYYVLDIIRQFK